ncbi:hypothetical protein G5I_01178 [Acromyrmex echinatior]|uniref:Uncharacterized protein n=1 Tax=Acromyrmex echinatior TaxID=103372 RepID=F4W6X1_ACREC|nr:hypothetical protein G5I_01178 [Acromyrmex echinatior]
MAAISSFTGHNGGDGNGVLNAGSWTGPFSRPVLTEAARCAPVVGYVSAVLPTASLFRWPRPQRCGLTTGYDIGDGPPAHDVGGGPPCRPRRRRCALLLGSKPVSMLLKRRLPLASGTVFCQTTEIFSAGPGLSDVALRPVTISVMGLLLTMSVVGLPVGHGVGNVPCRASENAKRTSYVRNRPLGPPTIAPFHRPTDEQFSEISYSPTLQTQPLDLTSSPVIDPAIQEILGYSLLPPLPPLEERFPAPPPHEEGFPLPLPPLDQFPPLPFRLNPEPIDWDRMFRFFTSTSYEGDRLVTLYIHGNPTPYTVLYKHLISMCSCNTFLTSHTR